MLDIGVDAELVGLFLLLVAAPIVVVVAVAVSRSRGFLFHLLAGHHELDRAGHVLGVQASQADHLETAAAAVQLVDQIADRLVIGVASPGDDRVVLLVDLQRRAWIERAGVLERFHQRLRINRGQTIDLDRDRLGSGCGCLTQIVEQFLDLGHLELVGPKQQRVVLLVGVDAEPITSALRRAARAVATRHVPTDEIVGTSLLGLGLFFLLLPTHHEGDRFGDRVGIEYFQRNDDRSSVPAVELVDQHANRHVIGQGGIGDQRLVLWIGLQPRGGIQVSQLLQGLDQRVGRHRLQPIDVHPLHVSHQRPRRIGRHVEHLDRLLDQGHFVGRGMG